MTEAEIKAALDGHYYTMSYGVKGISVVDLARGEKRDNEGADEEVFPDLFPKENKGGKPTSIDWSDKDDTIIALRSSGLEFSKIAKAVGVSPATVRWRYLRLCQVLGLDGKPDAVYKKYNPEIEAEIVAMRHAGTTFVAIGMHFGMSKASACTLYYRWYQRTHRRDAA
jgi:hypothetical protein